LKIENALNDATPRPRLFQFSIFNVQFVLFVLYAAASAYACSLSVQHSTPIDRALPFIAIVVTVLAASSYHAVMLAVPMLIVAEIAVADETARLIAFGVILAAVVCVQRSAPLVAAAAIVLLRWIPLEDVLWARELFLLAVAIAIVFVLGRTPFAAAIAVITALITPAVPLRTLALPLVVLSVAVLARTFGMPRLKLALPSALALAFVMTFFAWSGIVARALPYFLRERHPAIERYTVNAALEPADSVVLGVPHSARALIVSGANVPHHRRGALLGRVDAAPGFSRTITIGDAADWGYMRREHFYGARNPLPRDPAGKIRDYGYAAWVDGAGRVPLPRGATRIRVTADATLPPGALLQVEGFELAAR
jgi:hypothetical protein